MEEIRIKGKGVIPGIVSGEALVCPKSITGWGGIDPKTGIIKEHDNINKGKTIKDTILIMPGSKGSNGWSCYFGAARASGSAPKGWLFTEIDSSSGVASAVMQIPTIVNFPEGQNPCELIENGDYVTMNGTTGDVEIVKKSIAKGNKSETDI
jgi:hypothetical protein